jgi:long-chain acyl-CoA synthetase
VEDDAMNPAAWVERHARRQPGRPDAKWGEAVVAFVVAADRVNQPSVTDLDRTCLDHIARFKRPKDYRFVDALPVNNYGKVVKRELRDRLQADVESSHHEEAIP